jgi:hypothetical protein
MPRRRPVCPQQRAHERLRCAALRCQATRPAAAAQVVDKLTGGVVWTPPGATAGSTPASLCIRNTGDLMLYGTSGARQPAQPHRCAQWLLAWGGAQKHPRLLGCARTISTLACACPSRYGPFSECEPGDTRLACNCMPCCAHPFRRYQAAVAGSIQRAGGRRHWPVHCAAHRPWRAAGAQQQLRRAVQLVKGPWRRPPGAITKTRGRRVYQRRRAATKPVQVAAGTATESAQGSAASPTAIHPCEFEPTGKQQGAATLQT